MELTDGPGTPPAWIEWRERRYYRQQAGHYRDSGGWLLHRHVWIAAHGEIPAGYVIHHADHDKANNQLGNLRMLSHAEHNSYHCKDNHARGLYAHIDRSAVSKQSWQSREARPVVCAHCGGTYLSTGQRAKYCTQRCAARARRQRLAAPPQG